ncbi:MAG: hypothetical protein ACOY4I_04785 [Bacillota bacterium]
MDEKILKMITDQIGEVKDSIRRLHERVDEMIKAGYMTKTECEGYRSNCKKGGHPTWIVVLFSLCSGMFMFILANWSKFIN